MPVRSLYHGQISNSSAEIYASDSAYTTLTAITASNVTALTATFDLWIVDSGGSVANASLLAKNVSVPGEGSVGVDVALVQTMGKDQELHAQASAASAITLRVSGDIHE